MTEQGASSAFLPLSVQLADAPSQSRGAFRPRLAVARRPMKAKGRREGRAPAAPESVYKGHAHGVDHRCCRSPGLPCADGFNGVLRALLGERCTIAPVALRMADARARSGRRITASLDAQTPGVRTTRLLRPRTIWPQHPGLGVHTPDHRPNRCDRAVSYAHRLRLTVARPVLRQIAPALPRPPHPGPHLVTIAKRPSGRTGMANTCHKSEIRKSDIFLCDEVDRFWVFCPTPLR